MTKRTPNPPIGLIRIMVILIIMVVLALFVVVGFGVCIVLGKCPSIIPPPPTPVQTPQLPLPTVTFTPVISITNAEQALAEIRESHQVTVLVTLGAGPYTYQVNGEWKGFEIDLLKEMVKRWRGPENQEITINYVGVTIPDRERALRANRNAGFLIGAFSQNADRCANDEKNQVCTSNPHARDAGAILVNAKFVTPEDYETKDFCLPSLNSNQTYLVYLTLTTAADSVRSFKDKCGFMGEIQFEEVSSIEEAVKSVATLNQRAFIIEASVLRFYIEKLGYIPPSSLSPDSTVWQFSPGQNSTYKDILEIHQTGPSGTQERYVVLARSDKSGFAALVDETLEQIRTDNTYVSLCKRNPMAACN